MKQKVIFKKKENIMNWLLKKAKKTCTCTSNEHLLIFPPTVTGCVTISAFAFLVAIPACIVSSAIGIRVCPITAGIKN